MSNLCSVYWLNYFISFYFFLAFEVELPSEEAATSRVMVLLGHFDLPARSAVLEQVSYNGHDSCCCCTEKGETVSTSARGHVVTFPFRDTPTGHAELRTSKDIE